MPWIKVTGRTEKIGVYMRGVYGPTGNPSGGPGVPVQGTVPKITGSQGKPWTSLN